MSIPLGLIVDRLQGMENKMSNPSTKQKPINLPIPAREPDGKITCISFYKWLHLLSRMVDDLSLSHSNVQLQLCSDTKILPLQLREIVYDSQDLNQALHRLQSRFPPLSSTWPLLVSSLTSKEPTQGTHQEVIERCSDLLSSISSLQSLHPRRDLNREETLAALASLGSTTELQSGVVAVVRQFDYAKNLQQDDPRYSSYVSNLKKYLEQERETRQDILASVALGRRMVPASSSTPNVPSFASQATTHNPQPKKRNRKKAVSPSKTEGCSLCHQGPHPPFKCEKIKDIQTKRLALPPNLCGKCCHWIRQDCPHQENCYIKSFVDKAGVPKKLNLLCSVHLEEKTHFALCGSCAPGQAATHGSLISAPVVPGFMGLTSCLQKVNNLKPRNPTKIDQVAFMSEVLTIQGKDGNIARVIAHYDSLSGANFSSDIPDNFNWGETGATSEPFSLSTMMGKQEFSLPVVSLKIQRQNKKCLEASFLVNNYPEIEDTFTFPDLLKECGVSSISQEERQLPLRIMFGVPCSTLFPRPLPVPKRMASTFPFLNLHQSLITAQVLVSGRVSQMDPVGNVHSFMGVPGTSPTSPPAAGASPTSPPAPDSTFAHQTDSIEEEERKGHPLQD